MDAEIGLTMLKLGMHMVVITVTGVVAVCMCLYHFRKQTIFTCKFAPFY